MWDALKVHAFHGLGRAALWHFERQLATASRVNHKTLANILTRNVDTQFGKRYHFEAVTRNPDLEAAYRAHVPLSTYGEYEAWVERIADGEPSVLSADPTTLLASTSGTTSRPKRIPRTRRAQAQHLRLVVLAQQGVVNRGILGAAQTRRGINLMSVAAPTSQAQKAIPLMSGANAGLARMHRLIPLLWTSPETVFHVPHPPTALYLHALFALSFRRSLYIETPFAPQLVAWIALIQQQQKQLVRDLADGTLSEHLELTRKDRDTLLAYLVPDPLRAQEVDRAINQGLAGIIPRLWPQMTYLRTVTSGTFNLSFPRLRWLAGPDLPIQSGCHSSSEGVIGLNLNTDGSTHYTLAIGTSYFEFIPISTADQAQPRTAKLAELVVGQEYELVLTSYAGLYRYRLGDVMRIVGFRGTAPNFEFQYRRGTILNLVGEKTTEWHTRAALESTATQYLSHPDVVVDYTVAGGFENGVGRYTFFLELEEEAPTINTRDISHRLDEVLGTINRLYHRLGREPECLAPAHVRVVRRGTFEAMARLQMERSIGVTATQVKTPRSVTQPYQLELLEQSCLS